MLPSTTLCDTESLYASKHYPMYLTSRSDVLAQEVQAMTGTIARRRCIIVNKPDILSVYCRGGQLAELSPKVGDR